MSLDDDNPRDPLPLSVFADHFKISAHNLSRYCRLPKTHPLHLKHEMVAGQIRVTLEGFRDWQDCKERDRRAKRKRQK
jgi:hypothetical protein